MKSVITLALTLMSANAFAVQADVAGTLQAFKVAQKVTCREVTPLMAEANMKAGIAILVLLSEAEELRKAGKLEEAAAKEADVQKVAKASSDLSTEFNNRCVAESAIFAESAEDAGQDK